MPNILNMSKTMRATLRKKKKLKIKEKTKRPIYIFIELNGTLESLQ